MAYGKITLTRAEIDFLAEMNRRSAIRVEASLAAAMSPEERRFYENLGPVTSAWASRIAALREGRHGFSESDLLTLRGLLSTDRPAELPLKIVEAKRSGDANLAELEAEYVLRHDLSEKLNRPFLLDTSQDAEPDKDDEEQEDTPEAGASAAYR